MIENKVLKLLKETKLKNGVTFKEGQEIEVVMDVVYVGGFILPPNIQPTTLNWIKENPTLFKDVTMNW
jgi:hypothetical protein